MPLSAASNASLLQFRQANPAALEKLLDKVKAGDVSPADAAAQVPGLNAADIMDLAVNGLEDLAQNAGAQAYGQAGTGAASTFGGIAAGGTLASKGVLFNKTFETGAAAQSALHAASHKELSLGEKVLDLLPEFKGGLAKTTLKGLGFGLATAGGAFFVNPLLSPGGFLVGIYMGMKSNAIAGEKRPADKDPITAEEGAALKAAFAEAAEVDKGVIAAAAAAFDRTGVEISPEAVKVLDELAAFATSSPEAKQAARFLAVGDAVQGVIKHNRLTRKGKRVNPEPADPKPLAQAMSKLNAAELEEVRPFLWDALHDDKGTPTLDLNNEPELSKLIFSDNGAKDLAAYMVAAFAAAGSHGGASISKKEVNVLLAQLERFDATISHPALQAAGEQMTTMAIDKDAARLMAGVLDSLDVTQQS